MLKIWRTMLQRKTKSHAWYHYYKHRLEFVEKHLAATDESLFSAGGHRQLIEEDCRTQHIIHDRYTLKTVKDGGCRSYSPKMLLIDTSCSLTHIIKHFSVIVLLYSYYFEHKCAYRVMHKNVKAKLLNAL